MLVLAVIAVVAVFALAARERAPRRRAERRVDDRLAERTPRAEGDSTDSQLARLERAIDAMAIEVERMGENQRFLTRLVAGEPQANARLTADERSRQ